MSALRDEIHGYINMLPDSKLRALKPLLTMMADDSLIIETDLSEEERELIQNGRAEYEKGGYIGLNELLSSTPDDSGRP